MNIQVIAAASVPTPPAGEKTLFINTSDNNFLSWKDSSGTVTRFSDSDGDAECCACLIAKDYADGILCALQSGMLKPSDFNALVNLGFTANAIETNDGAGNTTCSVTLGVAAAAVTNPTGLAIIPATSTITRPGTLQLYPAFTPANTTNQAVNWISSDPVKATVSSTGLVTGVDVGVVTIYAYSVADNAVVGTKTITIS